MIKDGELITLDDNTEYIVIKKLECNNINYVILMTASQPVDFVLAKEVVADNNEIYIETVTDQEEAKYIMQRFINT